MQEIIEVWFQNLFSGFYPFFDVFWSFITFFGEELFMMIICITLYWVVDKKMALYLAFTSILSFGINGIVKDIAKIERPITASDATRFVEVDNIFVNTTKLVESYSFPSGHSQMATAIFGGLGFYLKNKKFWIFSIIMVVLICLSRIYLGVHWPLDVLVGSTLGIAITYFAYLLFSKASEKTMFYVYIGLIVLGFVFLLASSKPDTYKGAGAVVGLGLGVVLEMKFVNFDPKEGTVLRKVIRVIAGLIFVLAMKEGLKIVFNAIGSYNIFHFIRYLLAAFVATFIYPLIFKKISGVIEKKKNSKEELANEEQ